VKNALKLPGPEPKIPLQVEINTELYNAVERERKQRHLKKRQIVEYGFRAFLLATNPKEAERLGIKSSNVE
jgi:hypothetical protein